MPKKDMESDRMIDDFEDESGLEFEQADELDFAAEDDLLLDESEDDEDLLPSVLYKGITRPKTDDDWRQLLLDASREGIPAYKISDNYKEGALLLHPSFGIGVVTKVISPRKMEVIFENSKKLMAMSIVSASQAA
ncbi:MAG TPA: hypothetical protein HPP81_01040 [Deltaproteobacteria bacterium]|jgi:hypothetical protein|nr:hypothetical protein [Deltaproteobacteria bacterium]HIJ75283.1 hypothetical protein [Deltaproteobacteria bacterium]